MALSAKAGSFTGSGSTGNQSVTGVGFQPVVVIFWWNFLSSDTSGADFVLGMGVGISSSSRRAVGNYSTDALTSSANAAWNQSGTCIYAPGGSPRADFVSQDSDGFTINWISANSTVINYLALGGTDLTNVKAGAIAAKTTTGNQAYTGIGFQPTALILFAGKFSTDPLDQSTNGAAMIGFATSSTARGCISWRNKNGANPQIAKHRQSKSKCAISLTDTGIFTEADFVSFDADGFTLNFTTAGGTADVIYYLALRGPQFKVSSFNQATTTGNQSLTGAGFTPKASLMLSNNDTAANDDTTAAHALVSLGFATSTSARGALWAGETNNVSPTQADRHLDRTKLLKTLTQNSLTVTGAADHVSFDSDGQTINWTTKDATAREVLVLWLGDSAALVLPVTVATFTETGNAANLNRGLKLSATVATFTETGNATTLKAARALPVVSASFVETGNATGLKTTRTLPAASVSFVESGSATSLRATRLLPLAAESFTYSGVSTSLKRGLVITPVTAIFALTGNAASFPVIRVLSASSNTYSLSGVSVGLALGRLLGAEAGSFTHAGLATKLTAQRATTGTSTALTLTGNAAQLLRHRSIPVTAASFSLTASDASFFTMRTMSASVAAFNFTGSDATLAKPSLSTLMVSVGTFSLAGPDIQLRVSRVLDASNGSLALSGNDLSLKLNRTVQTVVGTFTVTGESVSLLSTRWMAVATGVFTFSGVTAAPLVTRFLPVSLTAYGLSGQLVSLGLGLLLTASHGVFDTTGADVGLSAQRSLSTTTATFTVSGPPITFGTSIIDLAIQPSAIISVVEKPTAVLSLAPDKPSGTITRWP